ncbi:hypothetical protein [Streptomyces sp. ZS0098]
MILCHDRGNGSRTAEGDEYRERRTRPLGKPLTLPGPFAFDLDTADFL